MTDYSKRFTLPDYTLDDFIGIIEFAAIKTREMDIGPTHSKMCDLILADSGPLECVRQGHADKDLMLHILTSDTLLPEEPEGLKHNPANIAIFMQCFAENYMHFVQAYPEHHDPDIDVILEFTAGMCSADGLSFAYRDNPEIPITPLEHEMECFILHCLDRINDPGPRSATDFLGPDPL